MFGTVACVALAQDPAPGWLGYATGLSPKGSGRLTFISASWTVGALPISSDAFYSPWFGIDTTDNLNLLQPVNPWLGDQWQIYNEYYQWSPSYNYNSDTHNVNPGDQLYGSITFNPDRQSYTIFHNSSDGWSVSTEIRVQQDGNGNFKNYSIAYFVYEKVADCSEYPPDGKVVFNNIVVEWDGVRQSPNWSTGFVEDVCNCRAAILAPNQVQITWDTSAPSPSRSLIERSQNSSAGWIGAARAARAAQRR